MDLRLEAATEVKSSDGPGARPEGSARDQRAKTPGELSRPTAQGSAHPSHGARGRITSGFGAPGDARRFSPRRRPQHRETGHPPQQSPPRKREGPNEPWRGGGNASFFAHHQLPEADTASALPAHLSGSIDRGGRSYGCLKWRPSSTSARLRARGRTPTHPLSNGPSPAPRPAA